MRDADHTPRSDSNSAYQKRKQVATYSISCLGHAALSKRIVIHKRPHLTTETESFSCTRFPHCFSPAKVLLAKRCRGQVKRSLLLKQGADEHLKNVVEACLNHGAGELSAGMNLRGAKHGSSMLYERKLFSRGFRLQLWLNKRGPPHSPRHRISLSGAGRKGETNGAREQFIESHGRTST